ncbi:MAG: 3-dehydroquinate synthase [Acidobacteria bacterium]|nr:MAG: 3-dehydroquinate synthase [Acidobacteriota bacterium]
MKRLQISLNGRKRFSDIKIGPGIRRDTGRFIADSKILTPRRVLLLSNKRVARLYGAEVKASLKTEGLKVFEWLMPEGERYKSFRELERAVSFLGKEGFERNDLVVALGGGVVGDLAGFASSIYLRGIPLVQMPTTLLSQIDSSVGGKTGINLPFGKNMVGSFYQPPLVLIDTETLATLPRRELVAGCCEMVKQSLVANRRLFNSTIKSLKQLKDDPGFVRSSEFESLIAANCSFKGAIVANDERESMRRIDAKSRKILNFGHTTAHALESITSYRVFRHGEAVGYGMLVAGELSKNLGMLGSAGLESLRAAVQLCGPLPRADTLDINKIIGALQHDKKSVAGQINWVLLDDIGSPRIVSGKTINRKLLQQALRIGLQQSGRQKDKASNE